MTNLIIGVIMAAVVAAAIVKIFRVFLRNVAGLGHSRPAEHRRARRGKGKSIKELARRLGVNAGRLIQFTPVYHEAMIPKRGGGTRRLLVPDPSTRMLQRRLLRKLLSRLQSHEAAVGFERGKSIVDNALPHACQAVVIRLDIVEFFANTTVERIEQYFRRIGWDKNAAALLMLLTTHEGGLPQGAPTSPRLSNLVNFALDLKLARLAERFKGCYTRYADDITFSFPADHPRHIRGVIQQARRMLRAAGYEMHERSKLHVRRRHQRQEVTGLVVNDKIALPRKTRRRLRAVRHRLAEGRPATMTAAQLQGWSALEAMVERQAGSGGG